MGVANIKIRFTVETNEVLLHPFYFTTLIKQCTKARESMQREALVDRVYEKLYDIAKRKGVGFTKRSAEKLIDLAVDMEFLHGDYHWDARGQVINVLAKSLDELSPEDRIAYLKYYFDADGGPLLYLVKEMQSRGAIERSSFLSQGSWERLVQEVLKDFLENETDPQKRSWLRKIAGYAIKGYTPHVREHRFNPRAETLSDLGIFVKDSGPRITYRPNKLNGKTTPEILIEAAPNIAALDKMLSPAGDFFTVAAKMGAVGGRRILLEKDFEMLAIMVASAYEATRDDTFRLAHLDAIRDIVCIKSLVNQNVVCEWPDVDATIHRMRSESERDVHYHVDDWGKVTYITMTNNYVNNMISQSS